MFKMNFQFARGCALVVLMLCGLLASPTPAHAGGAAFPFQQTWTVAWAKPTDSLKFDQFIRDGEAECDIAHCDACRLRAPEGIAELALADCEAHKGDPRHQCGGFEEASNDFAAGFMLERDSIGSCTFIRCLHCRAKALHVEAPKPTICKHHANGDAHYCHGVTVTILGYRDAMPYNPPFIISPNDFPAIKGSEAGQSTALVFEKTYDIQTSLLQSSEAIIVFPVNDTNHGQGNVVASNGVFIAEFAGASQYPIKITLQAENLQQVMTLQCLDAHQQFDLATFPQGKYLLTAENAAGEHWGGFLDLQTGNPPNVGLGTGFGLD